MLRHMCNVIADIVWTWNARACRAYYTFAM